MICVTETDNEAAVAHPHYQVLIFGSRSELAPDYGPPDPPPGYITVPHVEMWVSEGSTQEGHYRDLAAWIPTRPRHERRVVAWVTPVQVKISISVEVV